MRKLPVYLLIDISGSMMGDPIEAVKNGMQIMHSALRKDPYALESAYISIITFADDVVQVVPLTEVASFRPPTISAGGGTSLGGALSKVYECATREVQKSTSSEKGDWKPLVFIMTDGVPTDDLTKGLNIFKQYKWGIVVACDAGNGAGLSALLQITQNVVSLDMTDSSSIQAYFKWVSSSISASSQKVEDANFDDSSDLNELPPPPPEISLIIP
ncbi:MAG: VWA domain-containing protein [Planctomycetia bacterium]|nr:VWA domain-containing protein [Planctomycetia bacterium]